MSALQLIERMIPTISFVGMGVILCILKDGTEDSL